MGAPRIAVVGHVEHVTLGRASGVPRPGDVVHLHDPRFLPGGGGGIAFAQLCKSDAEVHLFTALGHDEGGRTVRARLAAAPARIHVHAAPRAEDHPRVVVYIDDEGRRTIIVEAPPAPARVVGDYGAGDSFAGALTFFLAHRLDVEEACRRAAAHGAAVLRGIDPLEVQAPLVAPGA